MGSSMTVEPATTQELVKRNFWFSGILKLALVLLAVILLWQIARQNVDLQARSHYPWRLHFLETSTAASLFGAFAALLLAREQFARSVRPALGWHGYNKIKTDLITEPAEWVNYVTDSGPGRCIVVEAKYRFAIFPQVDDGSVPPDKQNQWVPWREIIRDLGHVGLTLDSNYFLTTFGAGSVVPQNRPSAQDRPFAAFDRKSLATLQLLDVRLCVIDLAGDTYVRILRLLHIAPAPYPRTDASEETEVKTTHGRKIPPIIGAAP